MRFQLPTTQWFRAGGRSAAPLLAPWTGICSSAAVAPLEGWRYGGRRWKPIPQSLYFAPRILADGGSVCPCKREVEHARLRGPVWFISAWESSVACVNGWEREEKQVGFHLSGAPRASLRNPAALLGPPVYGCAGLSPLGSPRGIHLALLVLDAKVQDNLYKF